MNRRDFLATSAVVGFGAMTELQANQESKYAPAGPITLYYEIKVAKPELKTLVNTLSQKAKELISKGMLSFSMKQMVGDSTMVKNYPERYKGMLASSYEDGANEGTLPYFYTLFFRFSSFKDMQKSGVREWFTSTLSQHFHAYKPTKNGAKKLPLKMAYYEGVFQTIVAGDMNKIYKTDSEIEEFFKLNTEKENKELITVENHVSINDNTLVPFEKMVSKLLNTAQTTYQPSTNKNNGLAGSVDNRYYKRAVTTEILRNAFANGDERNYIMHGTWESVWDHENSHLDPRFKMAAAPVGSFVTSGPVEPFYKTQLFLN
jgi:hypothetical protein